VLVDAFRRLRARGVGARLVVVGDGPERERYHALAADLPEVVFVGRVPDGLPGYYANSTVYACPAVLGSFGITLLEAMSCSTPVVCYDTPGFRAVVRDGVEGLLTPPGDADALADALERVLGDAVLRARLGHAGRQRALGYAWPTVADAVLGVYARALGVPASARAAVGTGTHGAGGARG
jgi:glycosyltransferase involved in cell wall biosynthesis